MANSTNVPTIEELKKKKELKDNFKDSTVNFTFKKEHVYVAIIGVLIVLLLFTLFAKKGQGEEILVTPLFANDSTHVINSTLPPVIVINNTIIIEKAEFEIEVTYDPKEYEYIMENRNNSDKYLLTKHLKGLGSGCTKFNEACYCSLRNSTLNRVVRYESPCEMVKYFDGSLIERSEALDYSRELTSEDVDLTEFLI